MQIYGKRIIKNDILKAMLLASAFAGLMVLMGPMQDTNDDAIMAWQLSRGLGSLASFISPYLSLLISALYYYIPALPWWSLLLVAGAWTLLTVALYLVMTAELTDGNHNMVYLILFASVWLTVMRKVNFTRTAAAFAAAGMLLCLKYVYSDCFKGETKCRTCVTGICLVIIGCLIRFDAGIMLLPFLFVFLLAQKIADRTGKIMNRRTCFLAVILIGAVLFLRLANTVFFAADPDWQLYQTQNAARSSIVDYRDLYPAWEDAADEYMACGLLDKADLDMFIGKGYMGDPDVYDLNTLEAVGRMKGQFIGVRGRIMLTLRSVKKMLVEGKVILWVMLLYVYLFCQNKRKDWIIYAGIWGTAFTMLAFFAFRGRIMLRVWEPILLCVLLMGVLALAITKRSQDTLNNEIEAGYSHIWSWLCYGLAVIFLFYTGIARSLCHMSMPGIEDDRDEFSRARAEYIQASPERIYLLSQPLFHPPPNPSPFGIWETLPADYLDNYFSLSNWDSNRPENISRLNALGISNPTRALFERTDTYAEFMDDQTYLYLQRHYNSNITCSFVDEFPDGGAVLQYTVPLGADAVMTASDVQGKIYLLKSEADPRYQIKTWNMEGRIDGWDDVADCEALYCDIWKDDGQEYTFRLMLEEDGSFHAFFYDVDEVWMEDVIEENLIVLLNDGKYINLGEF